MARFTAPSLWLPGFSPEPLEPAALLIDIEPTDSDLASSSEERFSEEPVTEAARQRANWRVVTGAVEVAPRNRWPQLIRADLHNLGGSVTKFEANLAAIQVLRHIESEQRPASPDETQRPAALHRLGWLARQLQPGSRRCCLGQTCAAIECLADPG
ncbi:MAG: hypothetical protein Q7K57_36235 [Burkholderiaceae bacterium]|nr:hypothetical protein [Burkholderiaceae bacterium]